MLKVLDKETADVFGQDIRWRSRRRGRGHRRRLAKHVPSERKRKGARNRVSTPQTVALVPDDPQVDGGENYGSTDVLAERRKKHQHAHVLYARLRSRAMPHVDLQAQHRSFQNSCKRVARKTVSGTPLPGRLCAPPRRCSHHKGSHENLRPVDRMT